MLLSLLFLTCNVSIIRHCHSEHSTYEQFYQWGKNEYTLQNWDSCVSFMRRAVDDHRFYHDQVGECRFQCIRQSQFEGSVDELTFFHRIAQRALCILRCRQDRFGTMRPRGPINFPVEIEFLERRPYHYLQFCYWKQNDLPSAVRSAYTFLIANPGDSLMSANLRYYSTLPDFSPEMLVDLEQQQYQKLYLEGMERYDVEDWIGTVDKLEQSLEQYWNADEKCRLKCQESFDLEALDQAHEIYIFITSQHAALLRCHQNCSRFLSRINGNYLDHFLPSYFHHLQYAYWKENRGRKACQAVADYLLLIPNDETMLSNKKFYTNHFIIDDEDLFVPSQQTIAYYRRSTLESRALHFMEEKFCYQDDLLVPAKDGDMRLFLREIPEIDLITKEKSTELKDNFELSADILLDQNECDAIMKIKSSLQLLSENNEDILDGGLSLSQIAKLVERQLIDVEIGKLVIDKTESARTSFLNAFKLSTPLFFDSTRLICNSNLRICSSLEFHYRIVIFLDDRQKNTEVKIRCNQCNIVYCLSCRNFARFAVKW